MPFKQLSDSYETVKRKMNNWVVELGFSMDSKEIGCLLHPYFIDKTSRTSVLVVLTPFNDNSWAISAAILSNKLVERM